MKLIDEKTAAARLNVSVHTLQKNRRTGSGLAYYKLNRSVRYSEEDISEYLRKSRCTSTSQYEGGANAK